MDTGLKQHTVLIIFANLLKPPSAKATTPAWEERGGPATCTLPLSKTSGVAIATRVQNQVSCSFIHKDQKYRHDSNVLTKITRHLSITSSISSGGISRIAQISLVHPKVLISLLHGASLMKCAY